MNVSCLEMLQKEFTNPKDGTTYYICKKIADYGNNKIPNNVYIINSSGEYEKIGTYSGNIIHFS
jgi:hypothetical protein